MMIAIEFDARRSGSAGALTFGELDARSNRMAHALAARGLAAGRPAGVHLANRVEFLDLVPRVRAARRDLRADERAVPRARDRAHRSATPSRAAVVTTAATCAAVRGRAAVWDVDELAAEAAGVDAAPVSAPIDGDAPAAIVYTSGTTGAVEGRGAHAQQLRSRTPRTSSRAGGSPSADRYLAVLPLFHVHGLGNGVHAWLASAAAACGSSSASISARGRRLFDAFQPTLFFGVPTIYVRLLELPRRRGASDRRRMRLFVSGSAPLPAHVLEAFRERFGHTILERYGMSETLMIISNPYEGERRAGTVGLPLPGVSVRIVRPDGDPPRSDETASCCVRGPNVFAGYWRQPEATAAAFDDGWFRTGDLAERVRRRLLHAARPPHAI